MRVTAMTNSPCEVKCRWTLGQAFQGAKRVVPTTTRPLEGTRSMT